MSLTVRQVAEIVQSLRTLSQSLQQAARSPALEGEDLPSGTILASARGLANVSEALRQHADQLNELIPDEVIHLTTQATRQLVRIVGLDEGGCVQVVLPALDADKVWEIDASDDLLEYLSKKPAPSAASPLRLHAYVVGDRSPPEVTDWDL